MKSSRGINIGSVSILVIFVLLCLTTFATLSLVSANADQKLTKAAADSVTEFYKADSAAEEILKQIDTVLKANSDEIDEQTYFSLCALELEGLNNITVNSSNDGLSAEYKVPINENRELFVAIDILYPASQADKRYKIAKWQAKQIDEWELDDSLKLWDGTIN